jgi:hypothetical protein
MKQIVLDVQTSQIVDAIIAFSLSLKNVGIAYVQTEGKVLSNKSHIIQLKKKVVPFLFHFI